MAFSKIYGAQTHLLAAHLITIEVDLSQGLHSFSVVGLPGKAVEESRDRVSAAVKNSGFKSPKQSNIKTIVSLAPADLRKEGPAFDLPIALGYLLATGDISFDSEGRLFVGELSLDGALRPVNGVLSYACLAKELGFKEIYVPCENAQEAALIEEVAVYGVKSLSEAIQHLQAPESSSLSKTKADQGDLSRPNADLGESIDDIVGQESAKSLPRGD